MKRPWFNKPEFKKLEESSQLTIGYMYLTNNPFSHDCPCERLVAEIAITEADKAVGMSPDTPDTPDTLDTLDAPDITFPHWAHYVADKATILRIFDPRTNHSHRWAFYLNPVTDTPSIARVGGTIRNNIIYYLNLNSLLGNVDFYLRGSKFSGITIRSYSDGCPIIKTTYEKGRITKKRAFRNAHQ